MPTLIQLRNQQAQIINEVRNNEGIFSEELNESHEATQQLILQKVDAYAYVLKEDLPAEKAYWKDRKNQAQEMLKRISANKERMQQLLHSVSSEINLVGTDYTITPTMSTTRTIDLEKVSKDIGTIQVTIPYSYLEQLANDLPEGQLTVGARKVLLSDLPKEHPAIIEELRPTISITKTKK